MHSIFLPLPAAWGRVGPTGAQWPLTPHSDRPQCPVLCPCQLASRSLFPALPSTLSFPAVRLPFLAVTLLTHGTRLPLPAVLTQPELTSNQNPEARGSL